MSVLPIDLLDEGGPSPREPAVPVFPPPLEPPPVSEAPPVKVSKPDASELETLRRLPPTLKQSASPLTLGGESAAAEGQGYPELPEIPGGPEEISEILGAGPGGAFAKIGSLACRRLNLLEAERDSCFACGLRRKEEEIALT